MARPRRVDDSTLRMALVGYEIERTKITEKIAEVQAKLGSRDGASASVEAKPTRKRRRISAVARKRIAEATRKRWAAFHAAKGKGRLQKVGSKG